MKRFEKKEWCNQVEYYKKIKEKKKKKKQKEKNIVFLIERKIDNKSSKMYYTYLTGIAKIQ